MTKKEFIEEEEEIFVIKRNLLFIIPLLTLCCIIQNNTNPNVNPFVGEYGIFNALIILSQISIFIITSFFFSSLASLKKEEEIMEQEREKLAFWEISYRKAKKKGFETFLREIVFETNENKNQKNIENLNGFILLCIENNGNSNQVWNCIEQLQVKLHKRECEQFKAFLRFFRKHNRFLGFLE